VAPRDTGARACNHTVRGGCEHQKTAAVGQHTNQASSSTASPGSYRSHPAMLGLVQATSVRRRGSVSMNTSKLILSVYTPIKRVR
jgi:hypothetical protein